MRIAAFDPRVRTLNGLRAFDPRVRTLNGLGRVELRVPQVWARGDRMRGLGCNRCQTGVSGLGRLSRFGRLGDSSTDIDVVTGLPCDDPRANCGAIIPTTPSPISTTLTPPASNPYAGVISPQQQVAQAAFGTTNLLQLSPAQSSALMAAVPANASSVPSLTPQQITALANAAVPATSGAAAGTIAGIPSNYVWIGAAIFGGLLLLGKKR